MRKPSKEILKRWGVTHRQWKQRKRAELKVAIKVMNTLSIGCAYTPTANDIGVGQLCDYLEELSKSWSQKEWGK